MHDKQGLVYLVGAGPGDPGLLTVRGRECLQRASVVVYDGLVARELLAHVPPSCECIYAGKKGSGSGAPLKQEEINELLVAKAKAGNKVVRLKGGDPFVFGRGAEECIALRDAGIAFEVVPGVSAATAVPAYAGIPLTARGVAASAGLVTGHEAADKSEGCVDWKTVAGNQTIVLFMGWKKIASSVEKIIESGRDPKTSAAAIRWGTTADQECIRTTLEALPQAIGEQGIKPPMLVVIGEVVAMQDQLDWFTKRALFGRRVWVTRSTERGQGIASALRDLGAQAMVVATTCMEEASEEEAGVLAAALARASEFDWLFLTSATSVHACMTALASLGLDARALAGLRIAAVGSATHAALAERGLRADLLGQGGDGRSLAEDLLASTEAKGLRILFPRAAEGREEGLAILESAGHSVELLVAYRSRARLATDSDVRAALDMLRNGRLHCMAFFAPSQVEALCELEPQAVEYLGRLPVLAAIGKTTARALSDLGLQVHACASQPTSKDLAAAIVKAFS